MRQDSDWTKRSSYGMRQGSWRSILVSTYNNNNNNNKLQNEYCISHSSLKYLHLHLALARASESVQTTKFTPLAASDLVASKNKPFKGVGFNLYAFEFDHQFSTIGDHLPSIAECFIPRNENLDLPAVVAIAEVLFSSVSYRHDYSIVSETKGPDSTQSFHLELQKGIFRKRLTTSTRSDCSSVSKRLSDVKCGIGPSRSTSTPDGIYMDDNEIARGIVEIKDNTFAPAEGLRQGAAEATNVALHHISLGVPWDKVAVPNVGMSGYLIQFTIVVMLDPCYPVVVEISKVLDLKYRKDAKTAAGYLYSLNNFLSNSLPVDTNLLSQESNSARISLKEYFLKNASDFFQSKATLQQSLNHFFRGMGVLFESETCRKFVCFPICVKENGGNNFDLVFPNLKDFRIGFPAEKILRNSFFEKVKEALAAFHSQKVVHLDYYPSNIMWKVDPQNPDSVLIKIIDWDSVHFVGMGLPDKIIDRYKVSKRNDLAQAAARLQGRNSTSVILEDYDNSLVIVMEKFLDNIELQVESKQELDRNFLNLQDSFLESCTY